VLSRQSSAAWRVGTRIRRREFLALAAAAAFPSPHPALAALQQERGGSRLPVRVSTLNHVSFSCADLRATVQWFGRVFGLAVHAFQDYQGGQTVLRVGNGPSYMALSQRSARAAAQAPSRFPHFCWGVEDFDVDRILRALSEMQAPAQAVLREGRTINGVNFDDPDGVPLQFNPATACGGGGFLGDECDQSARAARQPGDPAPIPVRTLNHVKLIVPGLQRTLDWYLRLTDMKRLADQPAGAGPQTEGASGPTAILRVGKGPQFVALVQGSGPAAYRPHVGFGVESFDAVKTQERLAEFGVATRKQVRQGTTELLVQSPDGVEIQLQDVSYCGGNGPLGNQCAVG
jgi:catechol 2,3-dioxygenase-like lactoylglutathione lyase family enzyme